MFETFTSYGIRNFVIRDFGTSQLCGYFDARLYNRMVQKCFSTFKHSKHSFHMVFEIFLFGISVYPSFAVISMRRYTIGWCRNVYTAMRAGTPYFVSDDQMVLCERYRISHSRHAIRAVTTWRVITWRMIHQICVSGEKRRPAVPRGRRRDRPLMTRTLSNKYSHPATLLIQRHKPVIRRFGYRYKRNNATISGSGGCVRKQAENHTPFAINQLLYSVNCIVSLKRKAFKVQVQYVRYASKY